MNPSVTAPPAGANPPERLVLLSADESGRIPYLRWQAMGIDSHLRALAQMESMGYLQREPGNKFCRAFHLTELGWSLRADLRAPQREIPTLGASPL